MKFFEVVIFILVIFALVILNLDQDNKIAELQYQVQALEIVATDNLEKNQEQDALIKALTGTDYELKEKYLFQAEPHRINY